MHHDDSTTVLLQDTMSCIAASTAPARSGTRLSRLNNLVHPLLTSSFIRFFFISLPFLLTDAMGLLAFVIVLTPGFIRFAWYYWVTSVHTTVQYDTKSCRQRLDVFYATRPYSNSDHGSIPPSSISLPLTTISEKKPLDAKKDDQHNNLTPVMVFFPGGGWVIGYKLWGALLARTLTKCGITVVIADYRNFPWGAVPQQVQDVEKVLQWTRLHIQSYGGNPNNIVVGGESAGGHLAFMALWRIAQESKRQWQSRQQRQSTVPGAPGLESPTSVHHQIPHREHSTQDDFDSSTGIKGFVSLSTPYDLSSLQSVFRKHGFGGNEIDRIFGQQVSQCDPYQAVVKECTSYDSSGSIKDDGAVIVLPPIKIYHGSLDKTVPLDGAVRFVDELKRLGGSVQFTVYQGWNHTHGNVEGPMDGDYRFHREVFEAIRQWTEDTTISWPVDKKHEVLGRLCPHLLVQLASYFMPV